MKPSSPQPHLADAPSLQQTPVGTRFVYVILQEYGSLTIPQLAAHTGMSTAATKTAVERLREHGHARLRRRPTANYTYVTTTNEEAQA